MAPGPDLAAVADALAVASAGSRTDVELDAALMAYLGPGPCDELAAVLDREGLGEPNVERLLAAAPAVAAHVETCEACGDRQRAMVSVRALAADVPAPVEPISAAAPTPKAKGPGRIIAVAAVAALVLGA